MTYDFTRNVLLSAIRHIDKHPELLKGRQSSTYDLVYNNKRYPPILVLSEANRLNGGKELFLSNFGNNTDKPFEILKDNGFEIVTKTMFILKRAFQEFKKQYPKDLSKKFSKELTSYNILVKELPQHLREQFNLSTEYKIQGSVGTGNFARYPWIAIFDKRVTVSATKGYYIVLLFSDDLEEIYLTLNQGSTKQSIKEKDHITNLVYSHIHHIDGFVKGNLPKKSLTKVFPASSSSNGTAYEKTNLFYRRYEVDNFDEEDFKKHLNKLIIAYDECVSANQEKGSLATMKKSDNLFSNKDFDIKAFADDLTKSSLIYNKDIITRFVASLVSKPFVILSGLAGSGKTKIAHSFAQWLCQDNSQYGIVPVGADWTNREPLLGYPDGLREDNYVLPDNGVLGLILKALENSKLPYFLILDEMNLSHVERYFADFLSIMETKESIQLYSGHDRDSGNKSIPKKIYWPENLFIIGTVNIDESTYMFSPKVLDRANVIEFRISADELETFFGTYQTEKESLIGKGQMMGSSFLSLSKRKQTKSNLLVEQELLSFFKKLARIGAEFGYRSATEVLTLINSLKTIDNTLSDKTCLDIAIMQKLLPKIHGSRSKIISVLEELMNLCLVENLKVNSLFEEEYLPMTKYPISFEKLKRMYKNALDNGFASYAEA